MNLKWVFHVPNPVRRRTVDPGSAFALSGVHVVDDLGLTTPRIWVDPHEISNLAADMFAQRPASALVTHRGIEAIHMVAQTLIQLVPLIQACLIMHPEFVPEITPTCVGGSHMSAHTGQTGT